MPIYLYRCKHCGHKTEMLRAMNGKDDELECPQCGARELEKVVAPYYASIIRGGG